MPAKMFNAEIKTLSSLKVTTFNQAMYAKRLLEEISAVCAEGITSNVYFRMRYIPNLHYLSIHYQIPDEKIFCLIVGRRVLKSIKCNNAIIFKAASRNNNKIKDVSNAVKNDENDYASAGQTFSLFEESFYHNIMINDDHNIDSRFKYSQFSDSLHKKHRR